MKRFYTLLEAAEFATTLCKSWSFATADERYDAEGLLVLAETSDSEDPIDEGSFYVVSCRRHWFMRGRRGHRLAVSVR